MKNLNKLYSSSQINNIRYIKFSILFDELKFIYILIDNLNFKNYIISFMDNYNLDYKLPLINFIDNSS